MVKRDSIQVPAHFPNILKEYAKDMIRTQPFDVLCWSAAYFRCIANNALPPSKARFEFVSSNGCLTKEFLKTLVKQIGKGYFVNRELVQKRWKGLGLSERELFVLLAASGMLDWHIIHWIKLVAVMAAYISQNFVSSIDLMCEVLSNDADGGPNSMPFWMFKVGYTFLASLDGSVELKGNRELTDHELVQPEHLTSSYFRNALLDEWRHFASSQQTRQNLCSNLKFGNAYDGFKQSTDFQNLISLLKDVDAFRREMTNETKDENESKVVHELGAPWSWMLEFVEHNSPASKSYSFVELLPNADLEASPGPLTTPVASMGYVSIVTPAKPVVVREMPGIGKAIQQETIDDFINYLRCRSIDENGMIFPRHFKEPGCPKINGNA